MLITCLDGHALQNMVQEVTSWAKMSLLRGIFKDVGVPCQSDFRLTGDHSFPVLHSIPSSSPSYTQSNGNAEIFVKNAKHIIAKVCTAGGGGDDEVFDQCLLEIRNIPCPDSHSPFQILYGHVLCTVVPAHRHAFTPEWQTADEECNARLTLKRQNGTTIHYHHSALAPLYAYRNAILAIGTSWGW